MLYSFEHCCTYITIVYSLLFQYRTLRVCYLAKLCGLGVSSPQANNKVRWPRTWSQALTSWSKLALPVTYKRTTGLSFFLSNRHDLTLIDTICTQLRCSRPTPIASICLWRWRDPRLCLLEWYGKPKPMLVPSNSNHLQFKIKRSVMEISRTYCPSWLRQQAG